MVRSSCNIPTTKNHQKWLTKGICQASYLVLYTKLGKAIKRFRTAGFTDLDQEQFVLKLSVHLSYNIMDLCTKQEETRTKMSSDILSENQCNQKVAGSLNFDLLTKSSTCSSLFSSNVGI